MVRNSVLVVLLVCHAHFVLLLMLLSGTEWSQFTTSPLGFHEATLADSKCFVVIIFCCWYMYRGIDVIVLFLVHVSFA